jgi:hypothetical protein
MTVPGTKFSQITLSGSNPVSTSTFVGVDTAGPTDIRYTLAELAGGLTPLLPVGRTQLTGPATYYIRTQAQTVTMSSAPPSSPLVATATAHGLSAGDAVIFSLPVDRGPCTSISAANPAVVTRTAHGYALNDQVQFTVFPADQTTGHLPAPLATFTRYYVISPTANTFEVATTPSGTPINTTGGSTSGTPYVERVNSALPTSVVDGTGATDGGLFYVLASGLSSNSFEFATTPGGTAILTSTAAVGRMTFATGNDSNPGTSQTRTGAFLTPQACYNLITSTLDFNNNTVTMQWGDGTYLCGAGTSNLNVRDVVTMQVPWFGAGVFVMQGNVNNQDACFYHGAATPFTNGDQVIPQMPFAAEGLTMHPGYQCIGNFRRDGSSAVSVAGWSFTVLGQFSILDTEVTGAAFCEIKNGAYVYMGFHDYPSNIQFYPSFTGVILYASFGIGSRYLIEDAGFAALGSVTLAGNAIALFGTTLFESTESGAFWYGSWSGTLNGGAFFEADQGSNAEMSWNSISIPLTIPPYANWPDGPAQV